MAADASFRRFCSCHALFLCLSVSMNFKNIADSAACVMTMTMIYLHFLAAKRPDSRIRLCKNSSELNYTHNTKYTHNIQKNET